MTERVVIIGAGGFGRETLDVIEAAVGAGAGLRVVGVVDGGPREADLQRLRDRDIAYLGTDADWLSNPDLDVRFIVAIGDPVVREKVAARFADAGMRALSVVHPRAVIGSEAKIGEGVVIASGVQVSTNVTLGDHVHLNPGCIVGHDAKIEAFVSVNPGAVVSGNALIERGSLLGAGSVVLQGLTVGPIATVGASACVTKDVSEGLVVAGVPARLIPGGK